MMKKAVWTIAALTIGINGVALATPIAADSFDYPAGDLGGNGAPIDGWSSSWESTTWDVMVQGAGSLSYTDSGGNSLITAGNNVITPAPAYSGAWNKSYRHLQVSLKQSTYPEVWLSFLMGDYNVGSAWAGVSLYQDTTEKLFIGQTGNTPFLGVQEWNPASGQHDTTDNFTDPVLFVTRLVFETPATVKWTSWLNPELDATPADVDAFAEDTHSVSYINTIRIAGQSGVVFDELRIGTTYDDVSPIPEPASFGLIVLFACGTCFVRRFFVI